MHLVHGFLHGLFCHVFHYPKVATRLTENQYTYPETYRMFQGLPIHELSVLDWEHASVSEAVNQPVTTGSQVVASEHSGAGPTPALATTAGEHHSQHVTSCWRGVVVVYTTKNVCTWVVHSIFHELLDMPQVHE